MRVDAGAPLHLTYCTNIHAADGWPAVNANLRQYAPALKRRLSPDAPFGIGLRLSARDARELLDGHLDEFRSWLDAEGLYVALINGFPFGSFHRTAVKADVYAPDWRDHRRVGYTLDLIEILSRLVPRGVDGGVSTSPLSYKPWLPDDDAAGWQTVVANVARVAAALVTLHDRQGVLVHLDIEPEPDCSLENTDETIAFFHERLLPEGGAALARDLGLTREEAERRLLEHVRVCVDCCHFAVEYENPLAAIERLRAAGLQIGRIQLSSALRAPMPADAAARRQVTARLARFADSTYLHQVIATRDGRLEHFPDLDDALVACDGGCGSEWRVHFHVPLFTQDYDGLSSTQDEVRAVIRAARTQPITSHLEIETYTWDVLPGALKIDLLDSIGREYDWVMGELGDLEI